MIKKTIASLIILTVFTLMIAPIDFISPVSTTPILIAEAMTEAECRAAGRVWVNNVCQDDPITALARRILTWAQTLFAVVAIGAILFGAFMFITASGDDGKLKKARSLILYALVAVFIVAATSLLIAWIEGLGRA